MCLCQKCTHVQDACVWTWLEEVTVQSTVNIVHGTLYLSARYCNVFRAQPGDWLLGGEVGGRACLLVPVLLVHGARA